MLERRGAERCREGGVVSQGGRHQGQGQVPADGVLASPKRGQGSAEGIQEHRTLFVHGPVGPVGPAMLPTLLRVPCRYERKKEPVRRSFPAQRLDHPSWDIFVLLQHVTESLLAPLGRLVFVKRPERKMPRCKVSRRCTRTHTCVAIFTCIHTTSSSSPLPPPPPPVFRDALPLFFP
jgi:hypothetical protein